MCMERLVELHLWFLLCNLWWACFNLERLTHLFAVNVGILCHVTFEGFFGWSRKHTWIASIIQNQTRTILNIYIKKYNSPTVQHNANDHPKLVAVHGIWTVFRSCRPSRKPRFVQGTTSQRFSWHCPYRWTSCTWCLGVQCWGAVCWGWEIFEMKLANQR